MRFDWQARRLLALLCWRWNGPTTASGCCKPIGWCALLTSSDLTVAPQLRALAGRTLSLLGDPRPGVGLNSAGLPDIVWCPVEANDLGNDTLSDNAKPGGDFEISKFPVTVAQFQAFVADGGYSETWKHCWTDEGWEWKANSNGPYALHDNYGCANHPVVMVTFHEAAAFCKWLSVKRGECIALPTQLQWELAATGGGAACIPVGRLPAND